MPPLDLATATFLTVPSSANSGDCDLTTEQVNNEWLVGTEACIIPNVRLISERMETISNSASLMGRRSVEVRIKRWGKREFLAKMREWGKLGGRPIGSGKKQRSKRGVR